MENLSDFNIEKEYTKLNGIHSIDINKNYLSFSYTASNDDGGYKISGTKTFDLRLIKKTLAQTSSTYTIRIFDNGYDITVIFDIRKKAIEFKSKDNFLGCIYSHNI